MSRLVNPLGWRLYFSKYWNSNFFIDKKTYLLAFLKTRLLFEIILSILNKYYFKKWRRNILKFSTFRIFLNFDTIYILIGYKFYWNYILSDIKQLNYRKKFVKKEKMKIKKRTKGVFNRSYRWHFLPVVNKIRNKKRIDSFFFINPRVDRKRFKFLLKKMIYYFFLLPQFIFLKDFLSNSVEKVIPYSNKKIFFFGLNQKSFNIIDVLDLIEFYLRNRFNTFFVLYRIIKILKIYMRRQKLAGFKFLLAGRFSRRDRATFVWKTFGNVSLSSRVSSVNYYTKSLVLPYSKCIAKLWICQE